ncbi:two-component system response regulator [Vibrio sp. vnigr-6D03]|uniref:DNA-binding response regulator n=1 Tax=Vibrio penaeicida TaxID=104609 RepID=A0AAV5NZ50_9VIBR|nr:MULTISPECIES: response regulator transcription factor [Vibrio]PKF79645.1 two-component system response regulator [Vibrio sp. vnigr-6D03]RTZ20600.1 response regulator transcription factor [Vibrio penaeicida]GLQ75789.1 DNA-binding response regulator [Vibrio penaeicida]
MQVLIIDDDNQFAGALADYLELKGVECDFAYNGQSGLSLALQGDTDVIILDVNMPKMDGYEVCRMLREARIQTPVLMMTAYDTVEDELEGFRSGVDDFVVKPCPMPVVWARLQALSKRTKPNVSSNLSIGDLELDLNTQEAYRSGKKLKMTPIGWRILHYLVIQSPRVVPRPELENAVWPDDPVEPGNLNVQLSNLRKVLDKPFGSPLLHTRINAGIQVKVLE